MKLVALVHIYSKTQPTTTSPSHVIGIYVPEKNIGTRVNMYAKNLTFMYVWDAFAWMCYM